MFVLERVLGKRQPVGSPAHRGTAVEAGIAYGLTDPDASLEACVAQAENTYDMESALSSDPRRAAYRADIPAMVARGLAELRPYGKPSHLQGYVTWQPEGLRLPIVGYFDFAWQDHGIVVDLKTTEALPSKVKVPHARQCALYACSTDNIDARISYVTPKKSATYQIEDVRGHLECLRQIALRVEAFLALSDDPNFFTTIIAPDLESFYFNSASARAAAFEHWSI